MTNKTETSGDMLNHSDFLLNLDQVKESYRINEGDHFSSFDAERFIADMKMRNGGKTPCWELKKCERWPGGAKEEEFGVCITYPWGGWHCWALAGTLCGGMIQGSAAQKEGNCQMCQHYIELMANDPAKLQADSAYFSTVMRSVLVGIATVNPKGIIDFQSSRKFQEFFGSGVAGKNLGSVLGLSGKELEELNEWLADVFKLYGTLSWDMLTNMFPLKDRDIKVGERYYRVSMMPFLKRAADSGEEKLHRLLVQATDVSLEVRALELAARERAVTDTIIARVKNIGSFRDFIQYANGMIPHAESLVRRFMGGDFSPELLEEAYRIMHTMKGTSGNFAMDSFVKTAHQSEEFFGKLLRIFERENAPEEIQKTLGEYKDVFDSFQSLQAELGEAVRFMGEHAGIEIEISAESANSVPVPTRHINDAIEHIRNGDALAAQRILQAAKEVSLKSLIKDMEQQVERLARDRGKQIAFLPDGYDVRIDKDSHAEVGTALLHIIRNSVDHGIEMPEERMAKGKDGMGVIELFAERSDEKNTITIQIKDDGKGIDIAKIRKKAGLPDVVPDSEVAAEIFKAGFSTKEEVTTTSGRGIGMSAVKTAIEEKLKGKIGVRSTYGQGVEFTITIPAMHI